MQICRIYIDEYFYMNIDILDFNKNTLKFVEILSKSVKMTLTIKNIHRNYHAFKIKMKIHVAPLLIGRKRDV